MQKASARQLNFGAVLNRSAMPLIKEKSKQAFKAQQENFDNKYGDESKCPYHKAVNGLRRILHLRHQVKPKKSAYTHGKDEKNRRYDETKKLFEADNFKFYDDFAKLRFPGENQQLGITKSDRIKLQDLKSNPKEVFDFAGRIVVRNLTKLIDNLIEANKTQVEEYNQAVEALLKTFTEGMESAVSNQLEFFRVGAAKLKQIPGDFEKGLKQLLVNNTRSLQSFSLMQFGLFRKSLNELGVARSKLNNDQGDFVSQELFKLDDKFEIRSVSESGESPILVPKEEFLDELDSKLKNEKSSPQYLDYPASNDFNAVYKNLDSHGHARGCLANELIFPSEIRAKYPEVKAEDNDAKAYKLNKTVLCELAQYLNDVIEELVIPTLVSAEPN